MDNTEIKRRVIGLLTLAYKTDWDPETGDNLEAISSAIGSLLEDWGTYDINITIPIEYATAVRQSIEKETAKVSHDVTAIIGNFVATFAMLCHEVKQAYPDTNIDGFLQQLGLQASTEE